MPPPTVFVPLSVTDMNAFMRAYPAGIAYKFQKGTYRLLNGIIPKTGDSFSGILENGKRVSIVSGSRVLSDWSFDGKYWSCSRFIPSYPITPDACDITRPNCDVANDLFYDNQIFELVTSMDALTHGKWYYANNRIYVIDNPYGYQVDVSYTPHFFGDGQAGISNITIDSLIIEKYAAPTNTAGVGIGASRYGGRDWLIQKSEVRYCHGGGIGNDAYTKALFNYIHHNGGHGMTGAGAEVVIEGNEIAYNNLTAGYNPFWGAGGSKWVWTDGLIVRGNFSHHNRGPGLWTDINNIRTLYENNVCEDNTRGGIFHEISYDAVIKNNKLRRNGTAKDYPYYTTGAGIEVCNSRNVEVYDNYLEDNWQGITGLQDNRYGPGNHGEWRMDNFKVERNVVISRNQGPGGGRTGVAGVNRNTQFNYNQYTGGGFFYDGSELNWSGWQGKGFDRQGSYTS